MSWQSRIPTRNNSGPTSSFRRMSASGLFRGTTRPQLLQSAITAASSPGWQGLIRIAPIKGAVRFRGDFFLSRNMRGLTSALPPAKNRKQKICSHLFTYNVVPKLPAELEPLREMVYNLWWTWEPSARKLFRHLDPLCGSGRITTRCGCCSSPGRRAWRRWRRMTISCGTRGGVQEIQGLHGAARTPTESSGRKACSIAYFSAEFGFHESVPNYSGRPRHPGGRPLQIRQRPEPEFQRGRAALPARLFPPADQQGGVAGDGGAEPEFPSSADDGGADR